MGNFRRLLLLMLSVCALPSYSWSLSPLPIPEPRGCADIRGELELALYWVDFFGNYIGRFERRRNRLLEDEQVLTNDFLDLFEDRDAGRRLLDYLISYCSIFHCAPPERFAPPDVLIHWLQEEGRSEEFIRRADHIWTALRLNLFESTDVEFYLGYARAQFQRYQELAIRLRLEALRRECPTITPRPLAQAY